MFFTPTHTISENAKSPLPSVAVAVGEALTLLRSEHAPNALIQSQDPAATALSLCGYSRFKSTDWWNDAIRGIVQAFNA